MLEAALAACSRALELIDMRQQHGAHPRLGAVDVVPFIPLGKAKMKDAVDLAHAFGRRLSERFGVSVYFYGFAALKDQCVELPDVRRGGYEGLVDKMSSSKNKPDVGEKEFNARSGATVVGAREILVAYNIKSGQRQPASGAAYRFANQRKGRRPETCARHRCHAEKQGTGAGINQPDQL